MPALTKEQIEARVAACRTGGPGTVRRTVRIVSKNGGNDLHDKKVQNVLRRLQVAPVDGFDEVVFVKTDGAMVFKAPKVQMSQSSCWVVSGQFNNTPLSEVAGGVGSSFPTGGFDMAALQAQLAKLQALSAAGEKSAAPTTASAAAAATTASAAPLNKVD